MSQGQSLQNICQCNRSKWQDYKKGSLELFTINWTISYITLHYHLMCLKYDSVYTWFNQDFLNKMAILFIFTMHFTTHASTHTQTTYLLVVFDLLCFSGLFTGWHTHYIFWSIYCPGFGCTHVNYLDKKCTEKPNVNLVHKMFEISFF
jgi:hypothetical protein